MGLVSPNHTYNLHTEGSSDNLRHKELTSTIFWTSTLSRNETNPYLKRKKILFKYYIFIFWQLLVFFKKTKTVKRTLTDINRTLIYNSAWKYICCWLTAHWAKWKELNARFNILSFKLLKWVLLLILVASESQKLLQLVCTKFCTSCRGLNERRNYRNNYTIGGSDPKRGFQFISLPLVYLSLNIGDNSQNCSRVFHWLTYSNLSIIRTYAC